MTNTNYRWVIVAAGGLLGCVAIGAMFSLPVFLLPIARDTGWSVTGVSAAMTIGFLAMAVGSMAWGTLSDRFGPRFVALTGSVVLAASLDLASRATSLIQFQLIFGVFVGGATAAILAPMMACDHGSPRGLAGFQARLENGPAHHCSRCRCAHDSNRTAGPSSTGFERWRYSNFAE